MLPCTDLSCKEGSSRPSRRIYREVDLSAAPELRHQRLFIGTETDIICRPQELPQDINMFPNLYIIHRVASGRLQTCTFEIIRNDDPGALQQETNMQQRMIQSASAIR